WSTFRLAVATRRESDARKAAELSLRQEAAIRLEAERQKSAAEESLASARLARAAEQEAKDREDAEREKASQASEAARQAEKRTAVADEAAARGTLFAAYLGVIQMAHQRLLNGNARDVDRILSKTDSKLRGWEYDFLQRWAQDDRYMAKASIQANG